MLKHVITSLLIALPMWASAQSFEESTNAVLAKFKEVSVAHNGDVQGKLADVHSLLDAMKPGEGSEHVEQWLAMKGELSLLDGRWQEGKEAFLATKAASEDHDWGVWKKLIKCAFHADGYEEAKKLYEGTSAQLRDGSSMKRDFDEFVGGELESLHAAKP